jgi:hypothetical protein
VSQHGQTFWKEIDQQNVALRSKNLKICLSIQRFSQFDYYLQCKA